MKFHPKCRPPRGAFGPHWDDGEKAWTNTEPRQLGLNGRWRYDDGKPGLAFIGSIDGANIIWVASCKCTDAKCPRWKAMTYAREKLFIESVIVHERPKAR